MIRVLHVLSCLGYGGVEAMLYNYYCHMNRENIKFDFIVHGTKVDGLESRFLEFGSKIYHVTPKRVSIIQNLRETQKAIFDKPRYDVIHCHQGDRALLAILLAKSADIPKVIIHCHGINPYENYLDKIYSRLTMLIARKCCSEYLACSYAAALHNYRSEFVSKVSVLPNAIDISRFVYNKIVRDDVRAELGINEFFIIGQIGRFSPEKNHTFTLELAAELSKFGFSYKVLLIGEGPTEIDIKKKAEELDLTNNIIFTGGRSDVDRLLQAIDLLLLPSYHEGLGIVAIEAQAAGLKCIVSERVPREVALTDNITFLRLEKNQWLQQIIYTMSGYERRIYSDVIRLAGYDVLREAKRLEEIYADNGIHL